MYVVIIVFEDNSREIVGPFENEHAADAYASTIYSARLNVVSADAERLNPPEF